MGVYYTVCQKLGEANRAYGSMSQKQYFTNWFTSSIDNKEKSGLQLSNENVLLVDRERSGEDERYVSCGA